MTALPLRLGLVGPLPPPNGGMAMQTLQLARLLRDAGLDVEVVQTNAPYTPSWIGGIRGLRALFRLVPYVWRVWRLARRVDLIHLMANSGWSWQLFAAPVIWIGWCCATPVVVNYRGGEARDYLAASASRVKPTLRRASALVVPSGFLQEVFRGFGVEAAVIPNIIDLEAFRPGERAPFEGGEFTLVVTRNLEAIYGLDTAIRAVAAARKERPGLRLLIAGSGPLRAELEQLAAALEATDIVSFLGRLQREEIIELYRRADAMLNPARVDNMPNSVLEGLACGLPVISTNVGGVPFIVQHEITALLVEPDDVAAMAAAIVRLSDDPGLRASLGAAGRREVQRYNWDSVGPQWLAMYRRAVVAP